MPRRCEYCLAPYKPKTENQKFCTPRHKRDHEIAERAFLAYVRNVLTVPGALQIWAQAPHAGSGSAVRG